MKTAKMNVAGKDHTLCFSLRVVRDCADKFGGMDKLSEALTGGTQQEQFDNVIWLLSRMMDAGERYDKLEGRPSEKALSVDDLLDLQGVDDLASLKSTIFETMDNGGEAVETEPEEKNAETSQEG